MTRQTNAVGERKPPMLHSVYGQYWLLPLISALMWLGGLAALFGIWAKHGYPRYESSEASIVFISDVGGIYQHLFIAICVVTVAFYILSLFAERWLRHVDRIPGHGESNRKIVIYDMLAILFCILGSIALILVSAFNTYNYSTVHWTSTCVFILCVAISAIFQTLEIFQLKKSHPDRAHLLRNSVLKLIIVACAVIVAIAFAVLYSRCHGDVNYSASSSKVRQCKRITGAAAICEWTISLIFDAYLFTLVLDLWPASKTSPRYLRRLERWEQSSLEKMGVAQGMDSRTSYAPTTATGVEPSILETHTVVNGVVDPRFQVDPVETRVQTPPVMQQYQPSSVISGGAYQGGYIPNTYPQNEYVHNSPAIGHHTYSQNELALGPTLTPHQQKEQQRYYSRA